jgi:hypothetical protein
MNDKQLIEKLAAIEHERWADWQSYLHSKLARGGNLNAPFMAMAMSDFEHWEKQINTQYDELSEKEKDSDREQVERYFYLIQRAVLEGKKEQVIEDFLMESLYCKTDEKILADLRDITLNALERQLKDLEQA